MLSLISAWTNAWVNNGDAGDLRSHRAHYGVTVISASDSPYIIRAAVKTGGLSPWTGLPHYNDVIMSSMASQISSLTIVYPYVYSRTDQRKHQSSMSLACVWGIHRWPVNSPHKGPVTRKMFPFDGVIVSLWDGCPVHEPGCVGRIRTRDWMHCFPR